MEQEYNWGIILKSAIPISIIVIVLNYAIIIPFWKMFSLVIGCILASVFVYIKDKKKNNIFTASALVFLAYLVMKILIEIGIIA